MLGSVDAATLLARLEKRHNCSAVALTQLRNRTVLALSCARALRALNDSDVRGVMVSEMGAVFTASAAPDSSAVDVGENGLVEMASAGIQYGAPQHLDRLDTLGSPPTYDSIYRHHSTGQGIRIYTVDTGVRATHVQFAPLGRASTILNTIDAGGLTDCNGHGTHVASLAAGVTSGVAKLATVRAVRVLDCSGSGTVFSVVSGLAAIEDECSSRPSDPIVVVMSLNGGASTMLDDAVRSVIATCRAVVVVAAGNARIDACQTSPARVSAAITVAAVDAHDTIASFSNLGGCVDIAAPGVGIVAAGIASDTAVAILSGTSMSTPLVAGAAAVALQQMLRTWDGWDSPVAGQNPAARVAAALMARAVPATVPSVYPVLYAAFDASDSSDYGMRASAPIALPSPSPSPSPAPPVPSPPSLPVVPAPTPTPTDEKEPTAPNPSPFPDPGPAPLPDPAPPTPPANPDQEPLDPELPVITTPDTAGAPRNAAALLLLFPLCLVVLRLVP